MSKKYTLRHLEGLNGSADSPSTAVPSSVNPSLQPKRTSLITPIIGNSERLDDDSNDEWEENVELDQTRVRATVESVLISQKSQSIQKSHNSKQDNVKDLKPDANEQSLSHAEEDLASKGETKSLERRRAILQRKRRLRRHSLHLTLLIGHLLRVDTVANDDLVRAVALSVAPNDMFTEGIAFHERLCRIALWSRATFRFTAMPVTFEYLEQTKWPTFRLLCNPVERVVTAISLPNSRDIFDVCATVCALLRQLHVRCRLVSPLQPLPYQPSKHSRVSSPSTETQQIVQKGPISFSTDSVMFAWIEVWNPDEERWFPVDIYGGHVCISNPSRDLKISMEQIPPYTLENSTVADNVSKKNDPTETTRRRGTRKRKRSAYEDIDKRQVHRHDLAPSLFCHTVAVENGMVTDVTRRYMHSWPDIRQGRAAGDAFIKCVEAMGRMPVSAEEYSSIEREVKEFERLSEDEPIPTTLGMIQKHPRYVLERHIKKYEVIFPKDPVVGFINDEPVYLRENVHLLHTKDRWIRQMREVIEGEKALKEVKSKNGTDATVGLFGKWQTRPLQIDKVVDGKVPRGIHGNVDLWTEEHLPDGGTHVNMAFAKQAARKLNVDFASAMTGFELRRGRSVPKIEGVVVASENANIVRDAARELERAAKEREDKRLRMAAEEQWNKLLRKMHAREKVRSKYGNPELGLSYEARQKRAGERLSRLEKRGEISSEKSAQFKKETGNISQRDSVKAHTHTFGEEKCVEGNIWMKKCSVCGTEVPFEKL